MLESLVDLNLNLSFELVLLGARAGSYTLGFLKVGANGLKSNCKAKDTRSSETAAIPQRRKLPKALPR